MKSSGALFSFLSLLVFSSASPGQTEATKPNVVLIFADDLGFGDLPAFYEASPFKAPRLDRMASEGARLTSFYVPTPFCAPSRGTILTGRYPFRHSVVRNPAPDAGQNHVGLPPSEITIAEILRERGYRTAIFGKWHLGHRPPWLPRSQGFDFYEGILYSNDMFPVQTVRNEEVIQYPVPQSTLTRRCTDLAIDYIQSHQNDPFFLYLPMAMPHKPLAVSDAFYTPDTPDDLYADVIAELDHSVGRILDTLTELNLSKKTLVIFTSDNGPFYGGSSGPLQGMKGKTWEGGLRVPMIAWMPGSIPAGIVSDQPAGTIDILPTICQLAGTSQPSDRTIDGKNIWPLWTSESAPSPHEAIFGMRGSSLASIRVGKWKLHVSSPGPSQMINLPIDEARKRISRRAPDGVTIIAPFEQADPSQYPGVPPGDEPKAMMLFDLDADPGEQRDLSGERPEVVERLKALFDVTLAQVPDFPAPPTDYQFSEELQRQGTLMRLIGGELRYDIIPPSQQRLIINSRD